MKNCGSNATRTLLDGKSHLIFMANKNGSDHGPREISTPRNIAYTKNLKKDKTVINENK